MSISRPIFIPNAAINQVGFLSMGPNNTNTDKSDGENAIAVDSAIGNKGIGESNRDIKVGLEV